MTTRKSTVKQLTRHSLWITALISGVCWVLAITAIPDRPLVFWTAMIIGGLAFGWMCMLVRRLIKGTF